MYEWLRAALGLLLPAARRRVSSDGADEPPAKKARTDYAGFECEGGADKGVAAEGLPSKARREGQEASVRDAAPFAGPAGEAQSLYYEPPAKKRRVSALEILESGKMPYGSSTCLNKETLTLYHKPVPRLSAHGNGTTHVKPALAGILTPRPPIKERAGPAPAASEASRIGRFFCTAEEGVKQEEKEKYKQLLNLVKEKNPRCLPPLQATGFLNGQAYAKPPVLIASNLEERKRERTLCPSVPRDTSFRDGDVCSPQVPPRGDVTRVKNTKEEGRPGKLAAVGKQNGANIPGDALYQLRPSSVLSRKPSSVDAEANKSPNSCRKADDFPPITEAMEREIKAAFSHGEPNDVVSSAFKMNITRDDICTLQKYCWLNDEIINFYMNLVMERNRKEGYPAVHAFTTFFYRKLTSGGYAAVKRWTRGVDLFKQDVVLVPIHLTNHWTLVVIDMRKKTIQYLDSVAFNSGNKICETLLKYLQEESQEKRRLELDCSEWTLHSMRTHEIPQQWNGSDCGVFVCKYADYIARDKPLTFTQNHMPYFRKRMVWEIIHQQLL